MTDGAASRRRFLIGSATGVGAAWLELRWPAILAAASDAQQAAGRGQAAFRFFTQEQAVEVEAVAAQIIPSGDKPGAKDAQAVYFIDRALNTFDHDKQRIYSEGLIVLQKNVSELFAGIGKFSKLNSQQQIHLLTTIQNSEFFELIRIHTVMGFLAKPSYGGNRDQLGWKAIGFAYRMTYKPPFGHYDAEYQKDQK